MKIGEVLGEVKALRKAPCLEGQRIVMVAIGAEHLAAADPVGSQTGDQVLLALGDAASRYCMEMPVDAAVVAVVEK